MPHFSESDRERLHALLDTVNQIEQASIVANGISLRVQVSAPDNAEATESYQLFDSEPFRSLAISVRLVYMNDEPTNFASICNILYKNGEQNLRDAVSDLRKAYNDFLNGPTVRFALHGEFEGTTVGPRDVFEVWLYGGTFHQNPIKKAMHAELLKYGQHFTLGLHLIVMQIVQFILHLGFTVQTALAEEQRMHGQAPQAA